MSVDTLTGTEGTLLEIACDLLRLDRVSADDNFFRLGGDSLLATLLVVSIQDRLGAVLEPETIFEADSFRDLVRRIDEQGTGAAERSLPPLVPQPRDRPVPIAVEQEGIWMMERYGAVDAGVKIPLTLRIRAPLDLDVLERVFDALIERHESLRSRFVEIDGQPTQIVDPPKPFKVAFVDLSAEQADRRDAAALAAAERFMADRLDIAAGDLMRALAIRLGQRDHYLLVVIHHIVADAWTMKVVRSEIASLYAAFLAGEPSPLAPLPIQLADYALWQKDSFDRIMAENEPYWVPRMEGAKPIELPRDFPATETKSFDAGVIAYALSPELTADIRALAQREEATVPMVVLTVITMLYARWTGRRDVATSLLIATRKRPEVASLISIFMGGVVIFADAGGDPVFRQLLKQIKSTTLDALAHAELFSRMAMTRWMAHWPMLSQVYVNITGVSINAHEPQGIAPGAVDIGAEPTTLVSRGTPKTPYQFGFELVDHTDFFHVTWLYHLDTYKQETIRRFADGFDALLRRAADDPELRLAEIAVG